MYRELNDYEILYLVCDSDDDFQVMVMKYAPLLNKMAYKYQKYMKKFGYEYDDLYQIGLCVLYNTLKNYNDRTGNMFYTYLNKALQNKYINTIRENTTNKKLALNESFSYDNTIPNTNLTYLETFRDENALFFDSELDLYNKYINFKNSLSFDMACVFDLMLEGYNKAEIKKLLSISMHKVNDYVLQIKKQLNYIDR